MGATGKSKLFYLHVAITLFFMFGFGFLPPLEPITPLGMKLVGIFIGLIYAWSTTTMIWPSLLGMVAVVLSGVVDLKTLFADGFGNNTVVFILLVFIFAAAIEETGLTEYLARCLMNLSWTKGHPWRLVFVILFGSYIIAAATSLYPVVLIFWTIIYDICKTTGYKPFDKFPTLMLIGIMLCATLGSACLPFKALAMMFNGAYEALTGMTVGFLPWLSFSLSVGISGIIVYMLLMRFAFRLDLSGMEKASKESYLAAAKITPAQKMSLIMLIAFIALAILPTLISKTLFGQILIKIGAPGILICILALMILIPVDGKPLLNFRVAASKGIIWDVIIMFTVVFPPSSYLTGEGTGVKEFLNGAIGPLLTGQSPLVFTLLMLILPTIITNFANNTVVALIFLSVLCSLAETVGIDPTPIAVALAFCTQYAFLTPAASAPSAVLFGNTEWLRAKDIYKYMAISITALTILTITLTLTVGKLVF